MEEDDHREVVPEDLVFEILKEVPAKTLLRFRCVSKLWRSIIDNSNFILSHQTRSYSRLGATDLLLTEEGYIPDVVTDLSQGKKLFVEHNVSLYSVNIKEQSAPTLIDRQRLAWYPTEAYHHICYVHGLISLGNSIYNPSTRQTILLPPVTDDNILPRYYLGFDHSTKLYKVLAITCLKQRYIYNVLTLGTNSWRNVGGHVLILPQRGEGIEHKKMVYSNFANGVIFILTFTIAHTLHSLNLGESLRLHAFEVGDEKCRVIALPQDFLSMVENNFHLLHLLLHLLLANDRPAVMITGLDMMTIWILEDYAKQIWKREHIQYPPQWQQPWWTTTPLGTIHERKILFSSDLEIFYYDMECKTSITIPKEVFGPIQYWPCEAKVIKHVETLFKLKE